ncbi:MAG: Gfo/Idh/MocA family oxidoreductase [Armatimonadetes bacterium]|nr:Gfo/Idh/MocA family oxidoreductase [Armatimonadota bacterium]
MKVGLVGAGDVAHFGHVPALLQAGFGFAGVFDPDAVRRERTATDIGCPGFETLEGLLDAKSDVLVIASPPAAHEAAVLAAAERKIPVLCEKPLADSVEAGGRMIRAMAEAKTLLMVGFVYRFSPVAMQIRDWVKEGIVGKVHALRLIYDWDLHGEWFESSPGVWERSPRWVGRMLEGGPLVDCGVHQIDLARWWLGTELTLESAAGGWVSTFDAPDHVYGHFRGADGSLTSVETSFTFGHTSKDVAPIFTYDLVGDGGILHYNRNGYVLEARTGQGTVRRPGASEKNFEGMARALWRAIETGEQGDLATGQDGLAATQLAIAATEAAIRQRKSLPKPKAPRGGKSAKA